MIVLIPLAIGQHVPQRVRETLSTQTIDNLIVECATPGEIKSRGNRGETRIIGETNSRNACSTFAKSILDKYVCMQCRVVTHIQNDNFQKAIERLEEDSKLGAVAMCNRDDFVPEHILIDCVVVRTFLLASIDWMITRTCCSCNLLRDHLEKKNYSFKYLEGRRIFRIDYSEDARC